MTNNNNKIITLLVMLGIVVVLGMVVNAVMFPNVSETDEIILGEDLTQEQMDSIPTVNDKIIININDEHEDMTANMGEATFSPINSSKYKGIPLPPPDSYELDIFTQNAYTSSTNDFNKLHMLMSELIINSEEFAIYDNGTFVRMVTDDDVDYYVHYFDEKNEFYIINDLENY